MTLLVAQFSSLSLLTTLNLLILPYRLLLDRLKHLDNLRLLDSQHHKESSSFSNMDSRPSYMDSLKVHIFLVYLNMDKSVTPIKRSVSLKCITLT